MKRKPQDLVHTIIQSAFEQSEMPETTEMRVMLDGIEENMLALVKDCIRSRHKYVTDEIDETNETE